MRAAFHHMADYNIPDVFKGMDQLFQFQAQHGQAVAEGFGVTILSDMVYRPWSLDGVRLAATSISDAIPSMDIGLAWNRNSGLSRDAKVFVDVCRSGSSIQGGIEYDEPS